MRLKLSYPTQNSAKKLISASLKMEKHILPFWCSKETKLREFQFKLLHRRIATNDFLYKIGITVNSLIPTPSVEKQRKTWFTYFGAVNTLTPFGKTAING